MLIDPPDGCAFADRCPYRDADLPGRASARIRAASPATARRAGCTTIRPRLQRAAFLAREEVGMSAEPQLSLRGVSRYFTVSRGHGSRRSRCRPRYRARERPSAWWARAAAESRRSAARSRESIGRPPGRSVFEGDDITRLGRGGARAFSRRMQMIFQDPYSSLNPRMTVRELIGEGLEIHASAPAPSDLADRGDDEPGRAGRRAHEPLSARVLRRPAPANRDRPGARADRPISSSATSPSPRSTSRSRARSSIC